MDSLRRELSRLDAELESGRKRERDVLTALDAAEQQVVLLEALVARQRETVSRLWDSLRVVSAEINPREAELAFLGSRILDLETIRDQLGRALARTLLAEHRARQWGQLEILLGSDGIRELVARRAIIERVKRVQTARIAALKAATDSALTAESAIFEESHRLRERRDELAASHARAAEIAADLQKDMRRLSGARRSLESRLDQVRSNRHLLEARRREVANAQRSIQEIMQRIAGGEELAGVPLDLRRGLLPWPAEGQIAQMFGEVRNEELATVTENPGIDLIVEKGSAVTAVADGRVTAITWLRGYGNVCIIEHPGNFHTVYARLGSMRVSAREEVRAGSVLGGPWFDPVSGAYRIHFELWSGKEKQNPLTWLRPRPSTR